MWNFAFVFIALCLTGIALLIWHRRSIRMKAKEPRITLGEFSSLLQMNASQLEQQIRQWDHGKGLVPGTERHLEWFYPAKTKTELSVLYLHGFTASRQEIRPVPDRIAQAIKANLYFSRLSGHGRDADAFATLHADDWVSDALESLRVAESVGQRVIVMGTSTGATLAMYLAKHFPQSIAALMLFSPNLRPAESLSRIFSLPGGLRFAKRLKGPYRRKQDSAVPLEGRKFWSTVHRFEGVREVIRLCDHIRHYRFEDISIPLFIAYTRKDRVVDIPLIKNFFERWGTHQKTLFHVSEAEYHILTGDLVAPQTTETVIHACQDFLGRFVLQPNQE